MRKKTILFDLFSHLDLSEKISRTLDSPLGKFSVHEFPDEEIVIKIEQDVKNKLVILLASLDRPNSKIATLIFFASTLRDLGAHKIILIAPYLAYMRQDKAFHPGEGISSKYFAKLLSYYCDEIFTIDPHLHRWHSLSDIFSIPAHVLHAANPIAKWIIHNISHPVLIGPDSESEQWVSEIADLCKAPYLIVEKTRKGDQEVSSSIPKLDAHRGATPVLLDDIISTGFTMMETLKHIQMLRFSSIYCIGVHAVFAEDAYFRLLQQGIAEIVTCNTIPHPTNKIDVSELLSTPVLEKSR